MVIVLAQAINIFSQVLVFIVIVDVILSYVLDPYHPLRAFVDRLVEPLLAPIRRVVPPAGMLDFSAFILIILVQLIAGFLVRFLSS
jgi:YggT family protein